MSQIFCYLKIRVPPSMCLRIFRVTCLQSINDRSHYVYTDLNQFIHGNIEVQHNNENKSEFTTVY